MEAHKALMADASHIGPLIAVTRDGGAGRVTVTRAGRIRLDYQLDRTGIATIRHGLVSMARLARAAGAIDILAAGSPATWYRSGGVRPGEEAAAFARFEEALSGVDLGPNRSAIFSAHQMGSVRAGVDPHSYPCDPWGRVRASPTNDVVIAGLYVGDGSLFPTGIGVNPMITIMALARRVSRTILAET